MSRIGWLRATVLGANDGLVSTASLIVAWLRRPNSPWEVVVVVSAPRAVVGVAVTVASLCGLAELGHVGARAGDAPRWRGVVRVTLWGAVA